MKKSFTDIIDGLPPEELNLATFRGRKFLIMKSQCRTAAQGDDYEKGTY